MFVNRERLYAHPVSSSLQYAITSELSVRLSRQAGVPSFSRTFLASLTTVWCCSHVAKPIAGKTDVASGRIDVCNTSYFKYWDAGLPVVGNVSSLMTSNPRLVISSFTLKKAHPSGKIKIAESLIKKSLFRGWLKLAVAAKRETPDQEWEFLIFQANESASWPTGSYKKGKAVPLQACSGPEVSTKLRFPDFMTTAQDGGKIVSLTHRPPLPPQEIFLVLISVRGWVEPRAIVRAEEFYVNEKFQWHQLGSNQRPSDL